MRFLQVGDLHIGKRLNEVSLLEDQQYILRQILDIAAAEAVDALLICGDVYDKALPSVEAVEMLPVKAASLSPQRKIPLPIPSQLAYPAIPERLSGQLRPQAAYG